MRISIKITEHLNSALQNSGDCHVASLLAMTALKKVKRMKLKSIVSAGLAKMDCVTREEFEAQAKILERTQAKLNALEKELDAIIRQKQ